MSALLDAMRGLRKCYEADDVGGLVKCYDTIIDHVNIPGYPKDIAEKVAEFVSEFRMMKSRAENRYYTDSTSEFNDASTLMDRLSVEVYIPWLRRLGSPYSFLTGGGGDA